MPHSVRDAMTPSITLRSSDGLRDALLRLGYAPFGVVIERRRVLGVVARSDLEVAQEQHRRAVRSNPFLGEPRVQQVLRAEAMVVGPETPLAKAVPLMTAHQLPALPVLDGPRVVGVVTLRAALDRLGTLWQWAQDVA